MKNNRAVCWSPPPPPSPVCCSLLALTPPQHIKGTTAWSRCGRRKWRRCRAFSVKWKWIFWENNGKDGAENPHYIWSFPGTVGRLTSPSINPLRGQSKAASLNRPLYQLTSVRQADIRHAIGALAPCAAWTVKTGAEGGVRSRYHGNCQRPAPLSAEQPLSSPWQRRGPGFPGDDGECRRECETEKEAEDEEEEEGKQVWRKHSNPIWRPLCPRLLLLP